MMRAGLTARIVFVAKAGGVGLTLLDQARPAEKLDGNARRFVKAKLAQVEDLERQAQLVAKLLFGDDRRARLVWLARVAGQDETASAGGQVPRDSGRVRLGRAAPDGMVAAAIEKESERAVQFGKREHVRGEELGLDAGRLRALAGLLDRQRRHVDASDGEALLREPNTIGTGPAADLQRAAGMNRVLGDDALKLGGCSAGVPRQEAVAVAVVPGAVVFH